MRRVLGYFLGGLVVVMTLGPLGAATVSAKDANLDGRVGSTTGQFAKKYGDPTDEPSGGDGTYTYENKNYRALETLATGKRVHYVAFYSDDPDNVEETWSVAEATRYAKRFLPADVECGEAVEQTGRDQVVANCHSAALEPNFDAAELAEVGAIGVPGDVGYTLELRDGDAFIVVVEVGLAYEPEPVALPTAVPTAVPSEPEPEPVAGDSVYAGDIQAAYDTLSLSFDEFVSLSQNPTGDQEWIISLAAVLVTWQLTYDEWVGRVPPAGLNQLHVDWVAGHEFLDIAADLLITGFDSNDPTSIEQGVNNYVVGQVIIVGLEDQIRGL